ncbi:MAG: hypothetical protein RLZZ618_480 [Pseudomonadota bacterium]|jgi:choline dehydrogenase-like flavoprotein
MKRGGEWLSHGVETLALEHERGQTPLFDVVVVGSGYGGAVAAARLSGLSRDGSSKRLQVCVLERGVEYPAGSFPSNLSDLPGHQRISGGAPLGGQTLPEGLMDWHVGGDVWALVANGLGGGSLINAGVCEPAQPAVLARADWPAPWRGNRDRWLALYERAARQLGAAPWPVTGRPKQAAMMRLAEQSGGRCRPVSLTIAPPGSLATPGSDTDAPITPCIECGDCFSGCNVGAKRTLSHNYLRTAFRQQAQLFCGATVRSISPLPRGQNARWSINYVLTDPSLLPGCNTSFSVHARDVVLAAGTFGSTEILMRSRSPQMVVSGRLGEGFSANADILAAYYDTGHEVNASADETEPLDTRGSGPTITSQIEWPPADGLSSSPNDVMQDLTVPGALGWVFREILTTMMVPQRWTRFDFSLHRRGGPDHFAVDEAAVRRTLLTVSYANDGAIGRLEPGPGWGGALRDGSLTVRWNRPAEADWFRQLDARLAARTLPGSRMLRNPLTQFMPAASYLGLRQNNSRLVSVHPLGGCRMAESAETGVVDPFGRVFNAGVDLDDHGDPQTESLRARHDHRMANALHEGLHVLDGSIVPTALGINPLHTITALAEGAIDQWATEYGWRPVSDRLPLRPLPRHPATVVPPVAVPTPTAVRFGEHMTGWVAPWEPLKAPAQLRLAMRVDFDLVTDLRAFLSEPKKVRGLNASFTVGLQRHADLTAPLSRDTLTGMPRELSLKGEVTWLGIEPSWFGQRMARTFFTLLKHRFAADLAAGGLLGQWREKFISSTHFGAVRELAYRFEPLPCDWHLLHSDALGQLMLPRGTVLHGTKRLGYLQPDADDPDSINPWHQLTHIRLKARLPDGKEIEVGTLAFDPMALLARYDAPLRIVAQANAITAMRDVMSLGLYAGRLLFGLHMLSFRRAEYPAEVNGPRGLRRLPPDSYAGDPRFSQLKVTVIPVPLSLSRDETVQLRITRLQRSDAPTQGLPVVLFHGFGSGGIQFTHPTIDTPMAPWLAAEHGRDVWVAELRTSIGLSTAARQWVMDDIAKQDVPALIEAVCQQSGQEQVQVIAHCIGSAMFCMAALSGKLKHRGRSRVERAVLMQVGPCAVLPRSSRARGYLAMRMQQLIGAAQAGSVASQEPSDAEAIMDRLLGSFLYPRNQRAHYRLNGDLRKNTRRVNANRSAGIFGQLFQYENMPGPLLDVFEDLLGDCNLTTYAQTAHFASAHRLTNDRGDDAYVTDAQLRQGFDFPLLLLHGEQNQTFDRRTFDDNVRLLSSVGINFRGHTIPGFGHLDCVVGRGADHAVLRHIAAHLNTEPSALQPPSRPTEDRTHWKARLPAVGPWLGHAVVEPSGKSLRLRVGMRVDHLGDALHGVAAVVRDHGREVQYTDWANMLAPGQECVVEVTVDEDTLARALHAARPGSDAVQVLFTATHRGRPADAADLQRVVLAKSDALRAHALRRGVPAAAVPGLELDPTWLRRLVERDPQDLGLVLGACRQRPLMADRDMADRSMKHLAAQLSSPPPPLLHGDLPIDAVLLAGDQVYADSRVDATHPGATATRFFDAHREAWTAPGQRDVLRRRPVYMVTDDHEFRNEYNDLVARSRPLEFKAAREAWTAYQIAAGPTGPVHDNTAQWRQFMLRGFGVFLCDTRSGRADVATLSRAGASIVAPEQMADLKQWLLTLQHDTAYGPRAKIIVMASPLTPLLTQAADDPAGLRGDGWQRFPDSLDDLLGFIADHEIDNVLFLAGDYHRFADCTLSLKAPGKRLIQARSIVTGTLYGPYPFANAVREDWLQPPYLSLRAGEAMWSYTLTADHAGDGYTRLSLKADGSIGCRWVAVG